MPTINARTLLTLLNKDPLDLERPHAASVESRAINGFDYDMVNQTLDLSFPGTGGRGGRGTWRYFDFPLGEFVEFATAFSQGTYFNLYIRDRYRYERIS